MKLKLLFIVIAILLAFKPTISNPIVEEDIVTEIYFEDGNWYILISHNLFWLYGIESFQDISIYTSNGLLIIDPEFTPSFGNAFTVLTVDNLLEPVSISPDAGELMVYLNVDFQLWLLQEIKWGGIPNSSVGPVLPGQSINYLPLGSTLWIPVKNAAPYYYNGWWNGTWVGTFQGHLFDQNGNPVENAEIKLSSFTTLTTTTGGYFQKSLYARYHHLYEVIKDGEEYEIDYWLNMEPATTITMDLVVDMSVGIAEIAKMYKVKLNNYPNPFSAQTTIELKIDDKTQFSNGVITITNLSGVVISVIPLNRSQFTENLFRYEWSNKTDYNLPDGQYLISVVLDGLQVANSKMIISK